MSRCRFGSVILMCIVLVGCGDGSSSTEGILAGTYKGTQTLNDAGGTAYFTWSPSVTYELALGIWWNGEEFVMNMAEDGWQIYVDGSHAIITDEYVKDDGTEVTTHYDGRFVGSEFSGTVSGDARWPGGTHAHFTGTFTTFRQ